MANTKTVTLPAPALNYTWRQVPTSLSVHVHGAGEVKTDYPLVLAEDGGITDALLGSAIKQGFVRYIGTATTSAKEGESPKEACDRRYDEIIAGTYKPGQGGGPRADTYTIVLRESVVTALVNNLYLKKADAIKQARDDAAAAYRKACDKVAESIEGQTGEFVFAKMWPKIEAHAKAESARRDAAKSVDFDLGDFAPAS